MSSKLPIHKEPNNISLSQVNLPNYRYIMHHWADRPVKNPLESGCGVCHMPESREKDQMEDLVKSGYSNHLDHR
jgi:hypothetical protein